MQPIKKISLDSFNTNLIRLITYFISVVAILFFGIELYMLNKGFSIWDEGYYLLSYKMAHTGFYPHFTNTPFVVAKLFEWANPGIIAYRLIHLLVNLLSAIFFVYTLVEYLNAIKINCGKTEQSLLYSLAIYAALYTYQLAIPTLSYNHLNGFFVLIAQATLILAMVRNSIDGVAITWIVVSSCATVILVLIKIPTFIAVVLVNLVFVTLFFHSKIAVKYISLYLLGVGVALLLSLFLFVTADQWHSYLSFMQEHKTHTPYAVLRSFLTTGFDMLVRGGGVVLSSITLLLLSVSRGRFEHKNAKIYAIYKLFLYGNLIAWYFCFFKFIASPGVVMDVWVLLAHSTSILLALVLVSMVVVVVLWRGKTHKLNFIIGLLFITPIVASIGTVNGFSQVQVYLLSWCLLVGLAYLICLRHASNNIKLLLTFFVAITFLVTTGYFIKQMQPGNFAGYSPINENDCQVSFAPLEGHWVDKDTSQLLVSINKIIEVYPHASTLVFFDAPGLQYALGRESLVVDPWLSNLVQPMTKDDTYNCKVIEAIKPEKLIQSIFIVARQKDISEKLKACLGTVGYPDKLKLLGSIETPVGGITEPIQIYLHP